MRAAIVAALVALATAAGAAERPDLAPRVMETTSEHLAHMACGGDPECTAGRLASGVVPGAVYGNGVVWLREGLDMRDPEQRAVLLHELVHHLQHLAGDGRCAGELEAEAYAVHEAYLARHGVDFGLPPYDFRPGPLVRMMAEQRGCGPW